MSGARIARLIVVALLIALVAWIANNTYWAEVEVPMPLKGEAARNPFYAAQRFAEALGARSEWDRMLGTPPQDAVLVVSFWHWSLSPERRERLVRWVEAGGRLVVDRSLVGGGSDFESWSGIARAYREREAREDPSAPKLYPKCRALSEEGHGAHSVSTPGAHYVICGLDGLSSLRSARKTTWALRDASGIQALRVNVGRGSVTAINTTPFHYRNLFDGDHGALFVVTTQLRRGDQVHFLSEDAHPSMLALLWRLGAPAAALALGVIALALWRGGARFGPLAATPETARRSLAEQILGTGQFALRFGRGESLHAAAVRALNEAAQRRVSSYARLPSEERVATLARLSGLETGALAVALNYSGSRRSSELRSAIALLETARRRILIENKGSWHGNRIEHHHAGR